MSSPPTLETAPLPTEPATLETAPLPAEAHLRPSRLWFLVVVALLFGAGVLLVFGRDHTALAMGAAMPIVGLTFWSIRRANHAASLGIQALVAGRLEEARTLLMLAARQSRPFPKVHAIHLYNLARLELKEGKGAAALSLLSASWREGRSPATRALLASAFAEAWRSSGNERAAEAWSAEARRLMKQIVKPS